MPNRNTEWLYMQGKGKWVRVHQLNKYGKWSLDFYPNEQDLDKMKSLKEGLAIKNDLKKDDDGYFMTFSREPSKKAKNGKILNFGPPEVLDGKHKLAEGKYLPFQEGVLIGNGSDITLKLEVYTWTSEAYGKGRAARLASVRVDNLVPFTPDKDFNDDQKKLVAGLDEQPPQPLF